MTALPGHRDKRQLNNTRHPEKGANQTLLMLQRRRCGAAVSASITTKELPRPGGNLSGLTTYRPRRP